MVLGIHRTGNSNWRLAVENGFDPGHQIMHRDAQVILSQNLAFPLGLNPTSPEAITVYGEDGAGPVGIMNEWHSGHYDLVMHNEELDLHPSGTGSVLGLRTSMYLHTPRITSQYSWRLPSTAVRVRVREEHIPCQVPELLYACTVYVCTWH